MYTKIIGTGSYLPEQVRTNADLEKMVDTSDEWIVTRTGIRERHIAAPNETVSTMGFEAATRAIEMAGIEKDQIGLIVVATTSATHAFPSAACQIQSMLGIKGCPAFDVAAACAGFTYALSVADQYVKSGAVKYALVVGLLLFLAMARALRCWLPLKSRESSPPICMPTVVMENC